MESNDTTTILPLKESFMNVYRSAVGVVLSVQKTDGTSFNCQVKQIETTKGRKGEIKFQVKNLETGDLLTISWRDKSYKQIQVKSL